jgi:hypothetical protein
MAEDVGATMAKPVYVMEIVTLATAYVAPAKVVMTTP